MGEVRWSVEALADLEEIAAYIAADSPSIAATFVERVRDSVRRLAMFPRLGRMVPELQRPHAREVIVGRYRVFYTTTDGKVEIRMIRHGSRALPSDLG